MAAMYANGFGPNCSRRSLTNLWSLEMPFALGRIGKRQGLQESLGILLTACLTHGVAGTAFFLSIATSLGK